MRQSVKRRAAAIVPQGYRSQRSVDPQSTVPSMEVNEQDARDIAAVLATLN